MNLLIKKDILTEEELRSEDPLSAYVNRLQGKVAHELYDELLNDDPFFQWFIDEYASLYTDEQCDDLREKALNNLDYNLQFFSKLDRNAFHVEIILILLLLRI